MKFCDLMKTIWENVKSDKAYFIKVASINALVCLLYLIIPAVIKTFVGVIFASASENVSGLYEFLQENLLQIENVISAVIAFILVVACLIALISVMSSFEKDMRFYKLQQRLGMSGVCVFTQSLLQNVVLCIGWNVVALVCAELFAVIVSAVLKIEIAITLMYFLILIVAELLLVVIVSLLNYVAYFDGIKRNSNKVQ